jgi:FkbM family methyltransferase
MKWKQWLPAALRRGIYRNPRPALNDLDRKLGKYLDFRGGFFIEAGANDGYAQSNTYYLEKCRGWRGILIEGIPTLASKCSVLRSRSRVHNCALVSGESPLREVRMHYANLMSVVDGSLKSEEAQEGHLKRGIEIQDLNGWYSIDVPAKTLKSILDETPDLPEIDFLSLDVEGYELQVLKGLNLSIYRPRYILVEANFFEEVNGLLETRHYRLLEKISHHDYFYRAR